MDFGGRAPLRATARSWGDQVKYVEADVKEHLRLTARQVCPDGIVAWTCESEANPEEVLEAGSR
ncbi:aromatic-ring hydroxylase C-terminal domain-containing protein [Rhizobium anhuiense]|uniref:aromatic-ring hydroxylase C-terminal domain-containing protein n=1 Tax=Rhizobium anhuiense TaxID=1184720 RepID=UPI00313DE009